MWQTLRGLPARTQALVVAEHPLEIARSADSPSPVVHTAPQQWSFEALLYATSIGFKVRAILLGLPTQILIEISRRSLNVTLREVSSSEVLANSCFILVEEQLGQPRRNRRRTAVQYFGVQ